MQPTVNVPYTEAERGRTNHHTSRLLKRIAGRVPTLRVFGAVRAGRPRSQYLAAAKIKLLLPALLIGLLVLIGPGTSAAQTTSPPNNPGPQSDAQKAFEKVKALAGSWQGTIMGIPINVTIRAASSGTAILHEATTGGGRPPDHEITMFYVDGDRLVATHYCDAGNRARFEGKVSPDGKSVEFSFLDVAGSTRGGLVKRMMFTMIDANHHAVELTFIQPDGKPVPLRGEFQRDK